MPIRHEVQKISDLLRYFEEVFPSTYRSKTVFYYRNKQPGSTSIRRIKFFLDDIRDNSTLTIVYIYRGRSDTIEYCPNSGKVVVRTESTVHGYTRKKDVTYQMSNTEELMFQNSCVDDVGDNTVQDFQRIQELFDIYYELSNKDDD